MNIILRTMLVTVACLTGLMTVFGQDHEKLGISKEKLDEIKAQKSAYITTKLQLTEQEAQRFWPIYNAYDAEQETLRKELREMGRVARNSGSGLTEKDANDLIQRNLANKQKEVDLDRTYAEKFKQSIGPVKTVELRLAEQDFNREVLRRLKERMGRK